MHTCHSRRQQRKKRAAIVPVLMSSGGDENVIENVKYQSRKTVFHCQKVQDVYDRQHLSHCLLATARFACLKFLTTVLLAVAAGTGASRSTNTFLTEKDSLGGAIGCGHAKYSLFTARTSCFLVASATVWVSARTGLAGTFSNFAVSKLDIGATTWLQKFGE